jgi:acetyl esterase/lipase
MTLTRREALSMGCGLAATACLVHTSFGQFPSKTPAGPHLADDPLDYVNPEFRQPAEQMMKMMPAQQELNDATLPQIRAMNARYARSVLPSPAVLEKMIPGPPGAPDVRVFIVGQMQGASKPAVLHMHGGGYVAGSAATEKRNIQELSVAHDCVVVSVDYRLAPETPFPGSLEDNYAALRWIFANANELGVDTKRIAIKGESAGGGHAAALAIIARDRGEFPICFQVLIYPMLDDRTGSARHLPPYLGHFIWTEQENRFGWSSLLGVPAGSQNVPPNSVPARVSKVTGLPPAFVGVGSIDLFALEDINYASRMVAEGVSTQLNVVPGGFHGFDIVVPTAPLSVQFNQAWNASLKRAFAGA